MRFLDAKTVPGVPLVTSVRELNLLWDLLATLPALRAAVLLRDHLHVALDDGAGETALDDFLFRAHVALNRSRRVRGPLWNPAKTTISRSSGSDHENRKVRYCSLNPCRAGHWYVQDPCEWPWSTHRDLVGFSLFPLVAPHRDPAGFQRYCTRDSEMRLANGALPQDPGPGPVEGLSFQELLARVASLYRVTPRELMRGGRRRQFLLGAARQLLDASSAAIAREAGVHRSTVFRAPEVPPDQLAIVRAVARDRRFYPWTDPLLRAAFARREPAPGPPKLWFER